MHERIREELDEESYAEFCAAINDPGYAITSIVRALRSMGIEASETSIRRWRTHGPVG